MNGARTIGRDVRDPAALHHLGENQGGPVPQQVRAIHQGYGSAARARPEDGLRAVRHRRAIQVRERRGGGGGGHENIFYARPAVPLREREHFQLPQIKWLGRFHAKMAARMERAWR